MGRKNDNYQKKKKKFSNNWDGEFKLQISLLKVSQDVNQLGYKDYLQKDVIFIQQKMSSTVENLHKLKK